LFISLFLDKEMNQRKQAKGVPLEPHPRGVSVKNAAHKHLIKDKRPLVK
jgi:hypothetical protein